MNIGFPTEIPVGFVKQSLDLAEEGAKSGAEYILSFDGKLIAPGCKGESTGDSNLWGEEGPSNLQQSVKILKRCTNVAKSVDVDMESYSIPQHYSHLSELLNVLSLRIKRLRNRISGAFYLRKKLIQKCGDSDELKYKHHRQMSTLNQNTAECEAVIRCLLEMNIKTTEIMAALNNNLDVHIHQKARHINLTEHANNFQLLPPEVVRLVLDITKEENVQYIKQRSQEWFEVRKSARVTGSSVNKAIGLDTLAKQKEHHYVRVRGREPKPVSPELQKLFNHGMKNEINAIATLVATVVPAYLPACFSFYEVGPCFIHSESRRNLMEVSADGILQCSFGENCPNRNIHGDRRIVVEIKSLIPQDHVPETLFYEVPSRYMPQLQSELKAYSCSELWLVCSTGVSATVIVVNFDGTLWDSIWNLCETLYSPEKPVVPTKLHPSLKDLRLQIAESKQRRTHLLCEVPTVTGEAGNITLDPNFTSPYSPVPGRINIDITEEQVTLMNKNLSEHSLSAFKECHQVLRDPGKELLVFMLTDKDRKYDKNTPYSFPVAYALKGASIKNSTLKYLVDKLRNELRRRNISVICETYDGQWHKHITESSSGRRLTKMFGRENWNRVHSLSKDKCLEEISSMCVVKKSTQNILSNIILEKGCEILTKEVHVMKKENGSLEMWTGQKRMQHIHSVHPCSRPDLFVMEEIDDIGKCEATDSIIEKEKEVTGNDGKKRKCKVKMKCTSIFQGQGKDDNVPKITKIRKKSIGLVGNEKTLLDVLQGNRHVDDEDIENANVDNFAATEENVTLEDYLKSDNTPILWNILNELQNVNNAKWGDRTQDFLYPELLTDGNTLMKIMTVKELQIICMELHCATGRIWSTSEMVKADIVNMLVKVFGGNTFVPKVDHKRSKKTFNPETLVRECINTIKSQIFPVEHVQIPLASLIQIEKRKEWFANSTLPLFGIIPSLAETHEQNYISFFSYPNSSEEHQQVEFKTFDFTHILTNMHTQILTRGLPFCKREHFEQLCHERPDILSISLVCEKIDQQNAFTAMRMFNYSVEKYMREKGFSDTADFVRLVRDWHNACNKRGLTADEWVVKLNAMHQFLTSGVKF